jgi:alpha-ketoglutarate-dependent sulfate ester dioxygenase
VTTTQPTAPSAWTGLVDVRPVTAVIGAEIHGVDLARPLDPAVVAEITAALHRWKVVFFRDQDITPEQQIAFGRQFGDITPAHPVVGGDGAHGLPEIFRLDAAAQRKVFEAARAAATAAEPYGSVAFDTSRGWHTDITFVPNPALGSILRGVVVPPYGGDTLFTNLVAAYAALSAPIQRLVDGLQAVHRWHGYDGEPVAGSGPAVQPSAVHPVVRVHPETGERALFVNPVFTKHIVGLSPRESHDLLELLFHFVSRPDLTVRFRWEPGSIAFWDNRATAHLGPVDAAHVELERVVERITITGDLPVGPDGFTSHALTGDLFR